LIYDLSRAAVVVSAAAVMALLVYVVWRYEKRYTAKQAQTYRELYDEFHKKQRKDAEES